MARKAMNPIVRAITDAMWERDRIEMKAIDRLLAAAARLKPRRKSRAPRASKRAR